MSLIAAAPTPLDGATLFAKYLDLSPLHGRGHGLVRCIFHQDPTASLSVDVERGLFHCFGCGAQGGLRRFADLVGEPVSSPRPRSPESPRQEAMRRAAQTARRQGERAAVWAPWNLCADFIRASLRLVDRVRTDVVVLGPDHPRTWPALDLAAHVERRALRIGAELDDTMASGRLT